MIKNDKDDKTVGLSRVIFAVFEWFFKKLKNILKASNNQNTAISVSSPYH